MEKFKQLLEISPSLLSEIESRGFEEPTEIQEKSIPEILEGKDVIAGAATGSGKTLAFATGLVNNVKKDYGVQGLVLTPTRELAVQVAQEISDFASEKDLKVLAVYGGVSINNQIRGIDSSEIIVGTPGRILDHLERNSIDLSHVNTLVLDEADRMLDMGFRDDVDKIISSCSKNRQTLLFSATISSDVIIMSEKYMNNPVEVSAKKLIDPAKLEQCYYDVEDGLKFSLLKYLLDDEDSGLVMVFCRTRTNVDFIVNNLQKMGINAVGIHGGYTQDKRNRIIKSFHSNDKHILVATDVAARGLDIKGVSHVYNYDIPESKDDYIHRIGRTARAGSSGKVVNILTSRDYSNFDILMEAGFKIDSKDVPYIKKVQLKWRPVARGRSGSGSGRSFGDSGRGGSRGRSSNRGRGFDKSFQGKNRKKNFKGKGGRDFGNKDGKKFFKKKFR